MAGRRLPYPRCYCSVEVAWEVASVDDASGGSIDGADSMMTVLVLVEVRPFWSVAT